jgi:hypothetical protein
LPFVKTNIQLDKKNPLWVSWAMMVFYHFLHQNFWLMSSAVLWWCVKYAALGALVSFLNINKILNINKEWFYMHHFLSIKQI